MYVFVFVLADCYHASVCSVGWTTCEEVGGWRVYPALYTGARVMGLFDGHDGNLSVDGELRL